MKRRRRRIFRCLNPFYIRSRIPTRDRASQAACSKSVSIPFTSGHVFRRGSSSSGPRLPEPSQSLLHQVTYSDRRRPRFVRERPSSLNPFYIRSRIPTFRSDEEGVFEECLNPFYIRSRIPTWGKDHAWRIAKLVSIPFTSGHVFRRVVTFLTWFSPNVSIPFTSGHVFRQTYFNYLAVTKQLSQSLLHQVTYSDRSHPIDIVRSLRMSQSLLHQVTYSDSSGPRPEATYTLEVSIPFTSGHVFRPQEISSMYCFFVNVSIPFTSGHVFRQWMSDDGDSIDEYVSIPFTSGHVFRLPGVLLKIKLGSCLNPFYIRSRIPTPV